MNLPYFKTFLMLTYRFSIFLCCRQELARKRKTTKSRRRRSWEMTLRMKRARGGGLTKMEVKSLTITNLIFSWDQSTKLWLNVGRDFIKNLYRVLASFLLSSLLFFCVIWWYIRGEKTFLKSPHLKNTPLRSQYDQKVERSFRKRNSTLICDIYTYK